MIQYYLKYLHVFGGIWSDIRHNSSHIRHIRPKRNISDISDQNGLISEISDISDKFSLLVTGIILFSCHNLQLYIIRIFLGGGESEY